MKKTILAAVAAGALAVGGAASAQDFGTVLGSIFGFGTPTYNHNTYPGQYAYPGQYGYPTYNSRGTPAVVAGTQPYYGNYGQYGQYGQSGTYGSQVYVDQYGRQVTMDQYGRQVIVQPNTGSYGITGYDAWGRPVYGTTTYGNRTWDRDGDGVADSSDRWPNDRRYW